MTRSGAPPPIPDDVVEQLAAGELGAPEAAALRARAALDPGLSARIAAAERLEAALRSDGLLPAPLSLLSGVLEAVRGEPSSGGVPAAHEALGSRRLGIARVAAAALALALGAHLALGGSDAGAALGALRGLPLPAALAPDVGLDDAMKGRGEAPASLAQVRGAMPRLSSEADLLPGSPAALLASGAVFLAAGIAAAARRRPRRAASTSPRRA